MFESLEKSLLMAILFSVVGLAVFSLGLIVLKKLLPFDLHKELADDDNTAVGIVVGCVLLGQAIIIAAAIHG